MPRNVYQALYYNYLAINQGDRGGLYLLGVFHFHGIQNIPQDYEKARICFEMCETDTNKKSSNKYKYLVHIYFLGLGVEVNIQKGREYRKNYPRAEADSIEMIYDSIILFDHEIDAYLKLEGDDTVFVPRYLIQSKILNELQNKNDLIWEVPLK